MAVNQQNASALGGFSGPPNPNGFYTGAAGVMPGASGFIAAVLCTVQPTDALQTLFANSTATTGFFIAIEAQPVAGHVSCSVAVGDGAGSVQFATDLGPGPTGKLMLIHLMADGVGVGTLRSYVNGSLIGFVDLAAVPVASAGQPVVGAGDTAGGSPADFCGILGVAYRRFTPPLGAQSLDTLARIHFDSCHRSLSMGRLSEVIASSDFDNRFDVREGAVVAGSRGVLAPNGDLISLPPSAEIWRASAGSAVLTRVGSVAASSITNPVWTTPSLVPLS